MDYPDPMLVDEAPSKGSPRPPDSSLLLEARIKARKLRDFVKEMADEFGENEFASLAIILDYHGLRALVVEASPRLIATLPPEVPISRSGPTSGDGPTVITYRELLFFCDQIKDFLEDGAGNGQDAASLFGTNGFKHDPPLLAAARVKAQSLLDFVEEQAEGDWLDSVHVPATVLEDYHQLLALIREAAPDSASILPREIPIPVEPKPRPEDHLAPSSGPRLFSFWNRVARPKTPKYREFLYLCQQIARLLK
jgi:hypothetical protein